MTSPDKEQALPLGRKEQKPGDWQPCQRGATSQADWLTAAWSPNGATVLHFAASF